MKEEWLMSGAVVPVDVETTAALVAEIKRLIGVIGGMALAEQPAQQQEPVAYGLFVNGELSWDSEWAFSNESFPVQFDDEECRPLYTSPQSKPWVGLTEEEANELWEGTDDRDSWELIMKVQAKLKEKNT